MINIDDPNQIEIKDFLLPFSGRLDPNNKWIRLSRMIPCPKGTPAEGRTGCEIHQKNVQRFWTVIHKAPGSHWGFDYQTL